MAFFFSSRISPIHIHDFMALVRFIFMHSWHLADSYSWVHGILQIHIHEFHEHKTFEFIFIEFTQFTSSKKSKPRSRYHYLVRDRIGIHNLMRKEGCACGALYYLFFLVIIDPWAPRAVNKNKPIYQSYYLTFNNQNIFLHGRRDLEGMVMLPTLDLHPPYTANFVLSFGPQFTVYTVHMDNSTFFNFRIHTVHYYFNSCSWVHGLFSPRFMKFMRFVDSYSWVHMTFTSTFIWAVWTKKFMNCMNYKLWKLFEKQ